MAQGTHVSGAEATPVAGAGDAAVPWWDQPLVGFDLETTGVDPETARIVTANLTWHSPGQDPWTRDLLVNPQVPIPPAAAAVHGITTEYAAEHGVDPVTGVGELLGLLRRADAAGLAVVGFNVVYDLTVLDREARRHGLDPFTPRWVIDAYVLDKHVDTYRRGPRKLGDVCRVYGVRLDHAHSADADALAAVLVARQIGRRGGLPAEVGELHAAQVGWFAQQAASFEEYCARTGRVLDCPVNRVWPLVPPPRAAAAA
jgi:DNA polymerase-3 subunit epsilon